MHICEMVGLTPTLLNYIHLVNHIRKGVLAFTNNKRISISNYERTRIAVNVFVTLTFSWSEMILGLAIWGKRSLSLTMARAQNWSEKRDNSLSCSIKVLALSEKAVEVTFCDMSFAICVVSFCIVSVRMEYNRETSVGMYTDVISVVLTVSYTINEKNRSPQRVKASFFFHLAKIFKVTNPVIWYHKNFWNQRALHIVIPVVKIPLMQTEIFF